MDKLRSFVKEALGQKAEDKKPNDEKKLSFVQQYMKRTAEHDQLLSKERAKKNPRKNREPFTWRILSFFNFLIFVISIMVGSYLMQVHFKMAYYMTVVEGYDRGGLIQTIAVVNYSTGLISLMGFCMSNSSLHKRRHGSGKIMLYAHLVWLSGISAILLASIYMCAVAFHDVDANFEGGFYLSMLKYESDREVQSKIDEIQKDFKCCGNEMGEEWFKVSWDDMIPDDKRGVPRSCCDTSLFPQEECVNFEDIMERDSLTTFGPGCLDKIKSRFKHILKVSFMTLSFLLAVKMICFMLGIFNLNWVKNYQKFVLRERMKHLAKVLDDTEIGQKFLNKLKSKEESEIGSDILSQ